MVVSKPESAHPELLPTTMPPLSLVRRPTWGRDKGYRPSCPLVPERLRPWLLDPRSLTRRIRRACPRGFRLELLEQRWASPLQEEANLLGIQPRRLAIVRHVLLYCHDVPWVFARSIFPAKTVRGTERRLASLGDRPLGSVLFSSPDLVRGQVTIARLVANEPLFELTQRALGTAPKEAWSRRSVFLLQSRPLLVNEIFLAEIGRSGAVP